MRRAKKVLAMFLSILTLVTQMLPMGVNAAPIVKVKNTAAEETGMEENIPQEEVSPEDAPEDVVPSEEPTELPENSDEEPADTQEEVVPLEETEADSTALISGTYGENLTWIFDEATGTLTISGTGEMTNYSSSNQPWYSYQASIKEVVIEEGVTSIEFCAFEGCNGLTSIEIPKCVTSIGDYAFYGCSSLTSVVIPEGVTSIGSSAFSGCSSLMSIVIPDNVTSIGDYAFSSCSSLTGVVLPESLTIIGNYAFQKCSGLTSIEIPENVIIIGNYAFNGCSKLTDVRCGGSETDRANITIGTYNDPLLNETWHYGLLQDVVMIGEKTYTSLAEAITAANDGDAITLIHDVKLSEKLSISGKVTINLNGHAITADFTGEESVLSVETAGECTLRDSAENGMIAGKLLNNGKLTIESGTFTDIENNGQLVITDAVVNGSIVNGKSGMIAISGGKYTNAVEKAWCAEGYVPSDEAVDGYYGVEEAEEEYKEFYGTSITMGNELDLLFYFATSYVDNTGYAQIVREYADDREDETTIIYLSDCELSGSYYKIVYEGVAAKEMCDNVKVTIFDASGNQISIEKTESIRSYALRVIDHASQPAEAKTLMVDMLNYGAAAQTYIGYNTSDLANGTLTDAQKALGTQTMKACVNNYTKSNDSYYGTAFVMGNQLSLKMYVKKEAIGVDGYVVVSYTNHLGQEKTATITESVLNGNYYEFLVNEILTADGRCLLTCKFYKADGTEVVTVTESLESYVARGVKTYGWLEEVMNFSDSAYAYLHR